MSAQTKKTFFKKNGKILKNIQNNKVFKEKLCSLANEFTSPKIAIAGKFDKYLNFFKGSNTRIILSSVSLALLLVLTVPILISFFNAQKLPKTNNKYTIYSSKPLTLDKSTQDIGYKDSRAQKINEVFKAFNCPLEGMGDVFVTEADKNDIPWWLVAAVAFQESGCGKKTPKVNGEESYNAWGWGVYGNNTHSFDNWARGIETVSDYFSQKFYSKGVTDLCDIMKIYTPPSNGSWCFGVGEFAQMIQNYQSPQGY